MSEERIPLKFWFSTRKKLIEEVESLRRELEEAKTNAELLESSLEKWRKKSHVMDLLGDIKMFEKLVNYGSLDSILKRVEDYERLQNSYKVLERKNKRLESKKK